MVAFETQKIDALQAHQKAVGKEDKAKEKADDALSSWQTPSS
jgi:hypothetical protein